MTQKEFEKKWMSLIENELIKKFPDEFIGLANTTEIIMPPVALVMGSEFFGSYEIVDSSGKLYFNTDSYYKAKYILYSTRGKPEKILQPNDENKIVSSVKEYERLLDSILKEIERDYKKVFPGEHNFVKVSNRIFSALNLHRY
ncbi:MAG: hypothetical protein JW995_10430 [Melioribacteraceae bacterium]|nr:hypothetical protein [Melioribacteraceae bacterium]